METSLIACGFCGNESSVCRVGDDYTILICKCPYCGPFLFDETSDYIEKLSVDDKFRIACVLNERRLKGLPGVAIGKTTNMANEVFLFSQLSLDELVDKYPKKASDHFNRALLNLSRLPKQHDPFALIHLTEEKKGHLCLFSRNYSKSLVFLEEIKSQGLIRLAEKVMHTGCRESQRFPCRDRFYLTTRFWDLIEKLQTSDIESKQAFVAMWFDDSMDDYYKQGIEPAIKDAGYDPVRIDGKDFNGKICDEIVAEIKRSKFIISDFTGQRGGVYFEAGYGMGQGKPVIFTIKEDGIGGVHFDTRQYNHITYKSPEELRKKLYNRICATIV